MGFNFSGSSEYQLNASLIDEVINMYGVLTKFLIVQKINRDDLVFGDYTHLKSDSNKIYDVNMLPENSEDYESTDYAFSDFGLSNFENINLFVSKANIIDAVPGLVSGVEHVTGNLVILPNNKIMEIVNASWEVPGINNLYTYNDVKTVLKLSCKPYDSKLIQELNPLDISMDPNGLPYNTLDSYFQELNAQTNVQNTEFAAVNQPQTSVPVVTAPISTTGRAFVGVTTQSLVSNEVIAWEAAAVHRVKRVHHFYDLSLSTSAVQYMWGSEVGTLLNLGYNVVMTMMPTLGNANVSLLKDIQNGVMNPYIDDNINSILSLQGSYPNADIWMRFGHEMNGNWYPWGSLLDPVTGLRHLGNTPQDYIAAYKYIVDRFRTAGINSNMVKWVFSPNAWGNDNFSQYYPGDTYVDMISVSGFNFGTQAANQPNLTWQTFNEIHKPTYDMLTTLYPTKPYFIGGVSCAELGGPTGTSADKAAWIDDMALQLKNGYPKLMGAIWFNVNKKVVGEADWRIDSSPQSLAAINRMYSDANVWQV